jgi:hypothetical protein
MWDAPGSGSSSAAPAAPTSPWGAPSGSATPAPATPAPAGPGPRDRPATDATQLFAAQPPGQPDDLPRARPPAPAPGRAEAAPRGPAEPDAEIDELRAWAQSLGGGRGPATTMPDLDANRRGSGDDAQAREDGR